MKKNYVLDTNVLIHDTQSIFQFKDNNLYIPVYVLEELDRLKNEHTLRGRNSREICRIIDELRCHGSLSSGVKIGEEGTFTVYVPKERVTLPVALDPKSVDSAILQSAIELEKETGLKTILVTMDVNLRIRSESLGVQTASYESQSVDPSRMISGLISMTVESGYIDKLFGGGVEPGIVEEELFDNACLMITDHVGKTALGRYNKKTNLVLPVQIPKTGVMGITPRNREQQFALDMLLDDDIKVMTLVGMAGTGKTLLACAAGLQRTVVDGEFSRLIISRPVVPMGKDIGYLPGPQPLDAKILTPTGWSTMGDLKIGDYVISRDGKATKVLEIHQKGRKAVFKIVTNDGCITECCEDHLWLTRTIEEKKRGKPGQVRNTRQIIQTLTKNGKPNHYLPRNDVVEYNSDVKLPIPPYTLGALLGDGSFGDMICLSVADREIAKRVNEEIQKLKCYLTYTDGITYRVASEIKNNKPAKRIRITDINTEEYRDYERVGVCSDVLNIHPGTINYRCGHDAIIDGYHYQFLKCPYKWSNPIKNNLNELDLLNKKCYDKFIPEIYKYSTPENRINLLKGLMDTDGCVKKNGEASFTTTSYQLAIDVIEIVKSLGGRAKLHSRNRVGKTSVLKSGRIIKTKLISYEFTISLPSKYNPFYLERKKSQFKCSYIYDSKIKSIEFVGEKKCQCILVENDEHLYITDDFMVTHNTLQEKMDPWMQPIYDNLELLMMTGGGKRKTGMKYEELFKQDTIRVEPLTYIRGRSLPSQYIIIDEAQNLTPHEIKTIITRCGEGSKIVLTGDVDQIDSPYMDKGTSGLSLAVEKLHDNAIVGHLTLSKGERSELANLAATVM